jgi:hypothetical protein
MIERRGFQSDRAIYKERMIWYVLEELQVISRVEGKERKRSYRR